mmetsp:Transcript_40066/g.58562  ORF Transcript_40066/g.58562 Transcript_40066/m.58562 type:complete len:216 (+) Transcript_40066:1004-1651(+)
MHIHVEKRGKLLCQFIVIIFDEFFAASYTFLIIVNKMNFSWTKKQEYYTEGQDVIFDVILTAHHKGHFVYKACPIDPQQIPSQSCFDEYPLIFIEDMLYGAPADLSYPHRAYLAPSSVAGAVYESSSDPPSLYGMKFSHKFRLPQGLKGNLVLIQWHYFTSNSCIYPGYDTYGFPEHWNNINIVPECASIPEDGNGPPEQFWNCGEFWLIFPFEF